MNENEKPKIIIIGPVPPPIHGVTISTERLLNSALKDRFELVHLDTSDRRSIDNVGKFDIVNVYLSIKNICEMMIHCLNRSPAIIYIPISQNNLAYLRDGLFIIVGKFFSSAKIVIHLRGSYFRTLYNKTNFFMKRFIDLTMKCCDKVIVLGNCLKWIFDKWFDERDIEVVPNGTTMKPNIDNKFARGNDESVVLTYLGGLCRDKGTFELVKAFKLVTDEYPEVRLEIAGEWWGGYSEYKNNVLQFIQDNDLNCKINFNGIITGVKKEKFLVNGDIFILPSWNEGHPNVVIEAMSAANPVVATSVGAVPETVIDGETGILVEKQNPQALADAIIKLIENPEFRIKMGKAGRERYEQFYTQEKNINNMIRVFENTLTGNP